MEAWSTAVLWLLSIAALANVIACSTGRASDRHWFAAVLGTALVAWGLNVGATYW